MTDTSGMRDLHALAGTAGLTIEMPMPRVALVTIDRPSKANTIDDEMHYALTTTWQQLERRTDVGAIVLTGRGTVFCGGGDFNRWHSLIEDRQYRRNKMNEARSIIVNMLRCELPIVAALNGPAIGLGCSLALATDLVIMSDHAYLADPHVAHGIVAGDGGAALLPHLVPIAQARSMLLTGRKMFAEEAQLLSLASEVTPSESVLTRALEIAADLSANSAEAMRDTKRAINLSLLLRVLPALEMASVAESSSFDTDFYRQRVGHLTNTRDGSGDATTPLP